MKMIMKQLIPFITLSTLVASFSACNPSRTGSSNDAVKQNDSMRGAPGTAPSRTPNDRNDAAGMSGVNSPNGSPNGTADD